MAQDSPQKGRTAQNLDPGLLSRSLTTLVRILMFACATLFLAVLLEWLGMTFLWQAQGVRHSAAMLNQDVQYLSRDFTQSAWVEAPIQFATRFSTTFYAYLFQKTGIERGLTWLATAEPQQNQKFHGVIRYAYQIAAEYLTAAMTITQVFAVRLAILVLSAPAFLLLAGIGVIDGLVQRDIRRWSGGRESAFIYHWAKKCITPSLSLPWMLYLAMPVSIHPNVMVLPFAMVFALAMNVMTATFKKYL